MKSTILVFFMTINCIVSYSQDWYTQFNWDTIKFEQPYQYLFVDTSINNIWQIGKPHKIYFDSVYTGNNAIITDSINYYPIINHSYFDLFIGSFNYSEYYPNDIFIEMKHKYDTDTIKDGGYITVSYDKGNSWINILKDTINQYLFYNCAFPAWENSNLYSFNDSLYNGELGFSGRSNGWISTWFTWHYCAVKNIKNMGDTMILRFNFISDSIQTNKEGWMIDNIRLYSCDIGGLVKKSLENNPKIYPNPFNFQSMITLDKNYNYIESQIYNLQGELLSTNTYNNIDKFVFKKNNLKSSLYFLKINFDLKFTKIIKIEIVE